MSDFFKAYKRYIIHHPKRMQYKPTADKAFDKGKLNDVYKEIRMLYQKRKIVP